MTYATVIESLVEEIPELLDYPETKAFFEDNEWKTDYFAYHFYAIFSQFLTGLLLREEQDNALLTKCFGFMEKMAVCTDADVSTLLAVEVLETVFELPYKVYLSVEKQMMLPETQKLHEANKPYFIQPKPLQSEETASPYRTRAEKKAKKIEAAELTAAAHEGGDRR